MTKLLERAIDELRKLPAERQDELAVAVLSAVEGEGAPTLTPAQYDEVRAAMAARDFLTEEETKAMYAKR